MPPAASPSNEVWKSLLARIIMNNVQIYGNCLGGDNDLYDAIANYEAVIRAIPIDCVLRPEDSLKFVRKSLVDPHFGKVILRYE